MFKSIFAGAVILAMSTMTYAQENLVGDWSGNYKFTGGRKGETLIGVELKIANVEGNLVTGVAKTYGPFCAGEYQMRGKLDGARLGMISTNTAGAAGDCKFGFRATIEGTNMKGTMGNYELQLNKK